MGFWLSIRWLVSAHRTGHCFRLLLSPRSNLLEVTPAFPIGHGAFKCLNFQLRGVDVKIHYALTKSLAREFTAVEPLRRFAEGAGQRGQFGVHVGVTGVFRAAIQSLFHAGQARCHHRRGGRAPPVRAFIYPPV